MKSVIKFSGLIAAVLAIVAFILQLATPAITNINLLITTGSVSGTTAIFGKGDDSALAWSALLAWIFVLVSIVALCAVSILPLLGIKALEKYENLILFCVAGLLLVSGIFMFIVLPVWWSANGAGNNTAGSLGAGWIVGGILSILAACCAGLKPASEILGKK
ncbi:MAG: hypothetical protein J5736_03860 [Bacilli bacterium]|nr:hypothetical protein [Bacilli bacterium]